MIGCDSREPGQDGSKRWSTKSHGPSFGNPSNHRIQFLIQAVYDVLPTLESPACPQCLKGEPGAHPQQLLESPGHHDQVLKAIADTIYSCQDHLLWPTKSGTRLEAESCPGEATEVPRKCYCNNTKARHGANLRGLQADRPSRTHSGLRGPHRGG